MINLAIALFGITAFTLIVLLMMFYIVKRKHNVRIPDQFKLWVLTWLASHSAVIVIPVTLSETSMALTTFDTFLIVCIVMSVTTALASLWTIFGLTRRF